MGVELGLLSTAAQSEESRRGLRGGYGAVKESPPMMETKDSCIPTIWYQNLKIDRMQLNIISKGVAALDNNNRNKSRRVIIRFSFIFKTVIGAFYTRSASERS